MPNKDDLLLDLCRTRGWDGVLIHRRRNIAWLTQGADTHCNLFTDTGVARLLWTPQRKVVLCDNVDGPRLLAEEFGPDWGFEQTDWTDAAPMPPGRLGSDWPDDCLTDLRASLSEIEIQALRGLGAEVSTEASALLEEVRPGWSELEVAGELIGRLRKCAILAPVVLVGADERIAAYRHPLPTARRLEKLLMLVVCAERRGLIVALTRLLHFGRLPDDLRRRHDAVCRVDEAYHASTRPGVRWCDALSQGIEAYAEQGFADEWRKHFQGGPMGYATRDFWATPAEQRLIAVNQAIGWNPSITGTKSEDTILSNGEVLTPTPGWPMNGNRPDIMVRRTP
jgi:Xaa-Pro dipeptidase